MPAGGRRGVIAGGIITLVAVAFGVFVLPFAFTTPPPIITRFVATRGFSPGTDGLGAIATVAVRLSEPSTISITIKDPATGEIVARLADGKAPVRGRTLAVRWDGTGVDGRTVADGAYAVDLEARAGDKKFSKSRRVVVDTTVPTPQVSVRSIPSGCRAEVSTPGEALTVSFSVPTANVTSSVRAVGSRSSTSWDWNGNDSDNRPVRPGIQVVHTEVRDERGNASASALTCWVSHLNARAVPHRPSSGGTVGVDLVGIGDDEQVTLSLHHRLGTPGGRADAPIIGDSIGYWITGSAATTRVTIPSGTDPRDVWLLASTDSGHQALIGFGGTG